MAEDNDGAQGTSPGVASTSRTPLDTLRDWSLILLAVLAALGAVLHSTAWRTMDQVTLYYLITAGVLVLLSRVAKFSFGKDSISFELREQIWAARDEARQARDTSAAARKKVDQVKDSALAARAEIERTRREFQRLAQDATREISKIRDNMKQLQSVTRSVAETVAIRPPQEGIGQQEAIDRFNSDPQKGRWGGKPDANGRKLSASVKPIAEDSSLCTVHLDVRSTDPGRPLEGKVTFHLHPTFPDMDRVVPVVNGVAATYCVSYGAFTVGAEADGGKTQLELDLTDRDHVDLTGVPQVWLES